MSSSGSAKSNGPSTSNNARPSGSAKSSGPSGSAKSNGSSKPNGSGRSNQVDLGRLAQVPEKVSLDGIEARAAQMWDSQGVFAFERGTNRDEVFSIDTPPPTVSGSLHIGSVFGYVQADSIARYQRMTGKNVFYPMGWDDNGLATERRVENYYGVRCDPSVQYNPSFTPPAKPDPKNKVPISRRNFVELCTELTAIDEVAFENVWRRVGLSVDWSLVYATIGRVAQRASQRMFLRNLAQNKAYQSEAPTFWDVTFQTAVAQAEFEERETEGAGHHILFKRVDNDEQIQIYTTRPELLAACVAMVISPEHPRVNELAGKEVEVPVYGQRVKIFPHNLVQADKGTGIAMCCTFGDITDVTWWRELRLDLRAIMGRDGRIVAEAPHGLSDSGVVNYGEIAGLDAKKARAKTVEKLREAGALLGEPEVIRHAVKYFEKGDRPLEIVTSSQWYIRNGGRDADIRDRMMQLGQELSWHPEVMRRRYEDWVNGLNGDWLASRQRYFGVPFPCWYKVDANGDVLRREILLPDEDDLPIDPSSDVPTGYKAEQRGVANGFVGDPDIMDTWLTSSITPHIAAHWEDDKALFSQVFPMDIRPQGPEIIRTWLFDSVLRSDQEHGHLPWKHACINGWVLDPDRKKMSKSVGNVTTPMELIDDHGADAVRYWACSARPGTDTAFDLNVFKNGRRLCVKLLNSSKMVLAMGEGTSVADITEPIDLALLARLRDLVEECQRSFDEFDYARTLERTEMFFWNFCDNQLELVKQRAYGANGDPQARSAQASLRFGVGVLQRLFAPIIPFTTEEAWGWWQQGSIHRAPWPTTDEFPEMNGVAASMTALDLTEEVLSNIRKAKTEAKVSMRAEVSTLTIKASDSDIALLQIGETDLRQAGVVNSIEYLGGGSEFSTVVTLASVEAK